MTPNPCMTCEHDEAQHAAKKPGLPKRCRSCHCWGFTAKTPTPPMRSAPDPKLDEAKAAMKELDAAMDRAQAQGKVVDRITCSPRHYELLCQAIAPTGVKPTGIQRFRAAEVAVDPIVSAFMLRTRQATPVKIHEGQPEVHTMPAPNPKPAKPEGFELTDNVLQALGLEGTKARLLAAIAANPGSNGKQLQEEADTGSAVMAKVIPELLREGLVEVRLVPTTDAKRGGLGRAHYASRDTIRAAILDRITTLRDVATSLEAQ